MSAQMIAFTYLQIPAFSHFLYKGHECMIDERGILLVYNQDENEWIRLNEKEFRADYLRDHSLEITSLSPKKWHMSPYLDADETWEIYQKTLRGTWTDKKVS